MYISFPISYPISLLLDYLLGTHTKSRFRNNDLVALIELHTHNELKKMHMIEDKEGNLESFRYSEEIGLNQEQANLMISAIEMNKKKAREKMIPLDKVFMFDHFQNINDIRVLTNGGYSRIPIYEHKKDNIVGKY